MYLYWYKIKNGVNNFGDQLNPYIIGKLSKTKIKHLPIADTKIRRLLKGIKKYLKKQVTFNDLMVILTSLHVKEYYVAIGSVLEWVGGRNCHIWGAGIIRKNAKIRKAKFYAVRGELTRLRLKELGYTPPFAIGDPALLLPLIYTPKTSQKYKLGIIPHFIHYDHVKRFENLLSDEIILIDLRDDIEKIIDSINLCEKTISSSLHGIIVSHAYNIPSLWFNLSNVPLAGDDIKFADYFSSVNIKAYPSIDIDIKNNILNNTQIKFKVNKDLVLPNCDLKKIQDSLIASCPFDININYKQK